MPFLDGVMGTLGKKILESLKVLPKWLTRQLLVLINLVTNSGRLVPREKFLEEDRYKRFLSCDGMCGEAVQPLLGCVFQGEWDKMQFYCVLARMLDFKQSAHFFEFSNKHVCVFAFQPMKFRQSRDELRLEFIIIACCCRQFNTGRVWGPLRVTSVHENRCWGFRCRHGGVVQIHSNQTVGTITRPNWHQPVVAVRRKWYVRGQKMTGCETESVRGSGMLRVPKQRRGKKIQGVTLQATGLSGRPTGLSGRPTGLVRIFFYFFVCAFFFV